MTASSQQLACLTQEAQFDVPNPNSLNGPTELDESNELDYVTPDQTSILKSSRSRLLESNNQANEFVLYPKRWFVLFALTLVDVSAGFVNWYVPIANILKSELDMSQATYNFMTLMSYMTCIVTIYPMTELVDRYGLRFAAHMVTTLFSVTYIIEAVCLSMTSMAKSRRFWLFMVSELFAGLSMNTRNSIVSKLAREWFSNQENTIVQMILESTYLLGWALVGLVPYLVESERDLPKLSYLFVAICSVIGVAIVVTVTSAKPPSPPSNESLVSATASSMPRLDGILEAVKRPKISILILMYGFSGANFYFVVMILQDCLAVGGYDDKFCGLIVLLINASTIVSMNLFGYVSSRYKLYPTSSICIAYAMSLILFYVSILIPKMQTLIIMSSLLMSLTYSMSTAAIFKDYFSLIVGLVPEPIVGALKNITFTVVIITIDLATEPLRRANFIENLPSYAIPLGLFGITNLAINCASTFII